MNDLKSQLQRKLIANVIVDKCVNNKEIIFKDSWCTQDRIIRFTTPSFRMLFPTIDEGMGHWKTGDKVMFEIYLSADSFSVDCLFCNKNISKEEKILKKKLSELKTFKKKEDHIFILNSWSFPSQDGVEKIINLFDTFMCQDIAIFENNISKLFVEENYLEGAPENITLNRFERNKKARAACLAYHGTACVICGTDFEKAYGPEFVGKIEVHHIVPLNQIGQEYIVDPIQDLVPVCPNCHTAIHSKKNGVYTVEEMKKMLNKSIR